jgi:lipoprotein NlpI
MKGDYDRAIADYNEAIRLNPQGASAYRSRGTANFNLGRFDASVSDLTESLRLNPDQSYVLIWRYLSQSRSGDRKLAENDLWAKSASLDKTKWPAPVIDFLLGKNTPAELLQAAEHRDTQTRRGQVCEAEFYIGEWHLLNSRPREANSLLSSAERDCPKAFVQYPAAVAELKRIAE